MYSANGYGKELSKMN